MLLNVFLDSLEWTILNKVVMTTNVFNEQSIEIY